MRVGLLVAAAALLSGVAESPLRSRRDVEFAGDTH